jgi:hypothetical protein
MLWNIHGPFSIQTNGSLGQEILDQDGSVVAWTTTPGMGELIQLLLNELASTK